MKREAGETPARSRHCKRGASPRRQATVEHSMGRQRNEATRRKSGDLPVRLRLYAPGIPGVQSASIHHATYADREVNENGSRQYPAGRQD